MRERWIGFIPVEGVRRLILREILLKPEKCAEYGISDFQRKVFLHTCQIPFGETRTYGQIAVAIGCPRAARAVGSALNKNPWMIFIPCHRVVPSGFPKVIGGFRDGTERKRRLLKMENSI